MKRRRVKDLSTKNKRSFRREDSDTKHQMWFQMFTSHLLHISCIQLMLNTQYFICFPCNEQNFAVGFHITAGCLARWDTILEEPQPTPLKYETLHGFLWSHRFPPTTSSLLVHFFTACNHFFSISWIFMLI